MVLSTCILGSFWCYLDFWVNTVRTNNHMALGLGYLGIVLINIEKFEMRSKTLKPSVLHAVLNIIN